MCERRVFFSSPYLFHTHHSRGILFSVSMFRRKNCNNTVNSINEVTHTKIFIVIKSCIVCYYFCCCCCSRCCRRYCLLLRLFTTTTTLQFTWTTANAVLTSSRFLFLLFVIAFIWTTENERQQQQQQIFRFLKIPARGFFRQTTTTTTVCVRTGLITLMQFTFFCHWVQFTFISTHQLIARKCVWMWMCFYDRIYRIFTVRAFVLLLPDWPIGLGPSALTINSLKTLLVLITRIVIAANSMFHRVQNP